ncbi:MAG: regulatory iron-sulfur-containing complex subunit RicT [Bacteroidota bacterium]
MACSSCGTGGCGRSGGCATGGCNKLNTYDWLGNMLTPDQSEVDNVYEVRFKSTRKNFFRNVNGLRLHIGDCVVVESDRGYDVGTLSLGGVVAELQMKKKGFSKNIKDIPRIYRKANEGDIEQLDAVRDKEQSTLVRSREIIEELKLDMKLSEVEYQGDNSKAIFYYIADHRVDFRELIKVLAREFRIRVEMKQIGLRHEAGLVGGIGSCGRELCCSTWLTEFKTVSTSAARYQNLSLNPMKISGMCGRLKCCLNFELETYLDALDDFPRVNEIRTAKGTARLVKTDIFKRMMWFTHEKETTWYPLNVNKVKEVIEANKKGQTPEVFIKGQMSVGGLGSNDGEEDDSYEMADFIGATDLLEERKADEKKRKQGNQGRRKNNRNRNNNNRKNNPNRRGGQQKNNKSGQQGQKKEGSNQGKGGGDKPQGNRNNKNQNRKRGNNPQRRKGPRKGPPKGGDNQSNKPQNPK